MEPDFGSIASITAAGATGSGATWWLQQVNPWLAFVSGILTILFMSCGLWKMFRKK
jgi:hypothetical protein